MKPVFYIVTVILMALFWNLGQAEKVMRPNFKEIKLWSDEKFLAHSLTIDSKDPHANLTFDVLQELHGMDIHIEATFTQKLNTNYYITLNTTFDICRILNYNLESALGSLVANFFRSYGHIMKKCPIVKGHYYLTKFWLPEDPALTNLPEVDFEIILMGYNVNANKERNVIFNDNLRGELVVQDVKNAKRGILALLPQAG